MTDRKKPTAGFWSTVALVAVLAYPLSFGPACWLFNRGLLTEIQIRKIYGPFFDRETEIPAIIRCSVARYSGPANHDRDMIAFLNRATRDRKNLNMLLKEADAVIQEHLDDIMATTPQQ